MKTEIKIGKYLSWKARVSNALRTHHVQRDFRMTIVNQNDTLCFEDGLAEMAFMMEIGAENGEGNDCEATKAVHCSPYDH